MLRLQAELEAVQVELAEERDYSASLRRLVDRAKQRVAELEGGAAPDEGGVDLSFKPEPTPVVPVAQEEPTRGRLGRRVRKSRRKGGRDRGPTGNVYVFDDQDAGRAAFDEFFTSPDPELDKVRGFLLD